MSTLVKNQKLTFIKDHEDGFIKCTIRFDDECGNGRNSFAITGEINKNKNFTDKGFISGGCIHEDIEKCFPEFKHLIKWHHMNADEPMHYVSNTLYHASNRDCWGKLKGEVRSTNKLIKFNKVPLLHDLPSVLIKAIENGFDFKNAEVEGFKHDKEKWIGYTFKGIYKYDRQDWYGTLFNTREYILQVKEALSFCEWEIVEVATAWGEGKEPDLDAARSSAIWFDAELEDFTEEKLLARLPQLVADFKKDIEAIGLAY